MKQCEEGYHSVLLRSCRFFRPPSAINIPPPRHNSATLWRWSFYLSKMKNTQSAQLLLLGKVSHEPLNTESPQSQRHLVLSASPNYSYSNIKFGRMHTEEHWSSIPILKIFMYLGVSSSYTGHWVGTKWLLFLLKANTVRRTCFPSFTSYDFCFQHACKPSHSSLPLLLPLLGLVAL